MQLHSHLRDTEPFNLLPPAAFDTLAAAAKREVYPAGTFIFRQKDAPTGWLYVIREGRAEIPDGETELLAGDQVLAILEPGKEDELRRVLLKK